MPRISAGKPVHTNCLTTQEERAGLSYKKNELCFEGIPVGEILSDYGSPLLLLSERSIKENCARYLEMAEGLHRSLLPKVCPPCTGMGAGTGSARFGAVSKFPIILNGKALGSGPVSSLVSSIGLLGSGEGGLPHASELPKLFASVSQSPNLALLRLLAEQKLGFLVQTAEEIDRAIQAGVLPEHMIFCGPFKDLGDLKLAWQKGVGVIEIESWEEVEDLELAQLGSNEIPARICLRLAAPWQQPRQGLEEAEIVPMLERLRCSKNLALVGFSAGWDNCEECTQNSFSLFLRDLRKVAEDAVAYQHEIRWLIVGVRAHYGSFELEADAFVPSQAQQVEHGSQDNQVACDEFFLELQQAFAGACFDVYFSVGDGLFQNSAHLVTSVLRKREQNVLLDMPFLSASAKKQFFPVTLSGKTSDALSLNPLQLWAKELPSLALKRIGLLEEGKSAACAGDAFLLSDVAENLGHFQACLGTIASAVEILVQDEQELVVIKRRAIEKEPFSLEL